MLRFIATVFVSLVCVGGVAVADEGGTPDPVDIVEAAALPIHALWGSEVLSEKKFYRRLERNRAICFGETHTSATDHYAQLRALRALTKRVDERRHGRQASCEAPRFAVGFEMFQWPFQAALDGYVNGALTEAELITQSEYAVRWGVDFAFYRPLLERARSRDLAALALNARTELTRKIGRTGLASLTPEEQAELPELVLDDPEHLAYIYGLFGAIPGHGAPAFITNLYAAQTTWDETMADNASNWLMESDDDSQLVVFAGSVHCHRSAIPRRITRRTGAPVLAVLPILASELAAFPTSGEGYDVVVVLEDDVVEEASSAVAFQRTSGAVASAHATEATAALLETLAED